MRSPLTIIAMAFLVLFGAQAPSGAANVDPQPSGAVDRILDAFAEAWWGERPPLEELREIAGDAMSGLGLEALSGVELGRLITFQTMVAHSGRLLDVRNALERFLDDEGADGAAAQIHTLSSRLWSARDDAAQAEVLKHALTHHGLDAALEAGALHNLFSRFRGAGSEALRNCADELLALERFLKPEHASHLVFGFAEYHQMLTALDERHAADVERLRVKMVGLATAAAEEQRSELAARLSREAASFLDGPFVLGTLIGNTAPELTIVWSSDETIESLASLKGRVVVLDFWATWCGPCISSFPDIRELVAHYEGYPVTILGITSTQGFHIAPAPDRERIHTGSDREKEFALMAEYIPAQEITWPIIFTAENVFHPSYGVRGIPHVAIIDAAGTVRYNGLHPSRPLGQSLFDKAQKIDALLKEAGLPSPPPPPPPSPGPGSGTTEAGS